jgi:hypothetical protein
MNRYLDNYIHAKSAFISEMMNRYGADEDIFYDAPFVDQVIAIQRIFGHPMVAEDSWGEKALMDEIDEILTSYDEAIDSLGQVEKFSSRGFFDTLDFETIINMFMEAKRKVILSLRDALIPLGDTKSRPKPLKSLHDAVVRLIEPILPKMDFEKFWNESIRFSWDISDGKQEIPF